MAQDPDEVTGHSRDARTTDATPASPSTAEIRAQIEETRADMSETIDAIQERLSPSRMVTQAKETVKEATVGRVKNLAQRASTAAGDLAEQSARTRATVRRMMSSNFVPVALVSIPSAWLLMRALKRARTDRNQQLLIGAAAGAACWSVWKAQNSRNRLPGDRLTTMSALTNAEDTWPVEELRSER
jgi:Protein of unknown function (DUF3618)